MRGVGMMTTWGRPEQEPRLLKERAYDDGPNGCRRRRGSRPYRVVSFSLYPFPLPCKQETKKKYNTRCSLVVTDPVTSLALTGLSWESERDPEFPCGYGRMCLLGVVGQDQKQSQVPTSVQDGTFLLNDKSSSCSFTAFAS